MEWQTGMKRMETRSEMDEVYLSDVVKVLEIQADTELAAVQQLAVWLDRCPTPDDRWLLSRILMEEMRHAWQMCGLLDHLGEHEMVESMLWKERSKHKLEAFNIDFESFGDVAAFTFLIDRVGVYHLRDFQQSSFAPLARVTDMMLDEEKLHLGFGRSRMERLASERKSKDEAQRGLLKFYPRALDMFGKGGVSRNTRVLAQGIKKTENETLRQNYIIEVAKEVEGMGLDLPDEKYDRHIF
jgi:1,2-phenylacetyl-CoA epoxidase catalytic subunit